MKKCLLGFLYTFLFLIVGCFISTLLYYFNILSDKANTIFLYIIIILSSIIGSVKFSRHLKYRGIINGLIFYLVCIILFILSSVIIFKSNFSLKNLVYYLVMLLSSVLGGIIGKNKEEIDE